MSITARGGYQIVDLQNIDIPIGQPTDKVKVPGITAQVRNGYNKPLILYNCLLDGMSNPKIISAIIIGEMSSNIVLMIETQNGPLYMVIDNEDNAVLTENIA